MSQKIDNKRKLAKRRQVRTRAKLHGTAKRPRLSIFRSLKHISVQMIDDDARKTLFAVSDKHLTEADKKGKKPVEIAAALGKLVGQKAKEAKISEIVFDRGSFKYHGRVKALADGAREAGLKF